MERQAVLAGVYLARQMIKPWFVRFSRRFPGDGTRRRPP